MEDAGEEGCPLPRAAVGICGGSVYCREDTVSQHRYAKRLRPEQEHFIVRSYFILL